MLKQRILKKVDEQALHVKFFNKMKGDSSKNKKGKEKQKKKWNKGDGACENSRNQGETSKNGAHDNQKLKNKLEVMKVQCCCFQKFEHYDRECYFNKYSKENGKGVVQFAHVGSSD